MEPKRYTGFKQLFHSLAPPTIIEEGCKVRVVLPETCPEGLENITIDYWRNLLRWGYNGAERLTIRVRHNNSDGDWWKLVGQRLWVPEIFLERMP